MSSLGKRPSLSVVQIDPAEQYIKENVESKNENVQEWRDESVRTYKYKIATVAASVIFD